MYVMRSMGSDVLAMGIVLCLLLVFLAVKAVVFIVNSFIHYYKHKSLWIALAVFVALSVAAGILSYLFNNAVFLNLVYVGFAVLLITCQVVDMRNRDTLQAGKSSSIVDQVLHSSWLAGDDTVLGVEDDHLAA